MNTNNPSTCTFTIRGVNVQEGLARFAGDEGRYRHWLLDFTNHGPEAAVQIRETIMNGTQEAAIRLTHAFKGRAGMLSIPELHSIALSLEMTLRNNEPSSLWLEELELTIKEMTEAITAELGEKNA
jgi:HPt (histidine-containing phosphotransfer) domain-containing protein